jgi:hypothetical protein
MRIGSSLKYGSTQVDSYKIYTQGREKGVSDSVRGRETGGGGCPVRREAHSRRERGPGGEQWPGVVEAGGYQVNRGMWWGSSRGEKRRARGLA